MKNRSPITKTQVRGCVAFAAAVSTSLALAAPAAADPVSVARAQGMVHYTLATGGENFTTWASTYKGFDTKAPDDNGYLATVKKALDSAALIQPDLYHAKPEDMVGSVNPVVRLEAMKVMQRWTIGGNSAIKLGNRGDGTLITRGDINPKITGDKAGDPATVADLVAVRVARELTIPDSPLMKASIILSTENQAARDKVIIGLRRAHEGVTKAEASGDQDRITQAKADLAKAQSAYDTLFGDSTVATIDVLNQAMDKAKAKGLHGPEAETFITDYVNHWATTPVMSEDQIDAYSKQSFDLHEDRPTSFSLDDLINLAQPSSDLLSHLGAAAADNQAAVNRVLKEISDATGGHVQAALDTGYAQGSINDATTYPAWSTSKVALSIAALKAKAVGMGTVNAAITASDNGAAAKLWSSLGGGTKAAQAADAILRAGGDNSTRYQARQVAPPYSAFGQTMWTARNQAHFGRNLQCIPGADPVIGAMGRIISSQAYGMGHIKGARFKGGWGPDPAGKYTTRQFGFIPDGKGGVIGISLVARPTDGTYPSGQSLLSKAAAVISKAVSSGALRGAPVCGKPESKPAPKAEAKPAPKQENKPAPKADNKPAAKPEQKADNKPAPKQDAAKNGDAAKNAPEDGSILSNEVLTAPVKLAAAGAALYENHKGEIAANMPNIWNHPELPNPQQQQKLAAFGGAALAGGVAAAAPFQAGLQESVDGAVNDKWDGTDESIHSALEMTRKHLSEDVEQAGAIIATAAPVLLRYGPELAASAPAVAGFIATGHLELAAMELLAHQEAYLATFTAVVVPVVMKAAQLSVDLVRVLGNVVIGAVKGVNRLIHDWICDGHKGWDILSLYECEGDKKNETPADPYKLKAESVFVGFPNVHGIKVYDELKKSVQDSDDGHTEKDNADEARRFGVNKLNATAEQRDLHQAHYIETNGKLLPGQKGDDGDKAEDLTAITPTQASEGGPITTGHDTPQVVAGDDNASPVFKAIPALHKTNEYISVYSGRLSRHFFFDDGKGMSLPAFYVDNGTVRVVDAASIGYVQHRDNQPHLYDQDQTEAQRAAEVKLLQAMHLPLTKTSGEGDKATTVPNHIPLLSTPDVIGHGDYSAENSLTLIPGATSFAVEDVKDYPLTDENAQAAFGAVQFVDRETGGLIAAPAVAGGKVVGVDGKYPEGSKFIALGMPDEALANVSKEGVVPVITYKGVVDPALPTSAEKDSTNLVSRPIYEMIHGKNSVTQSNLGLGALALSVTKAQLPSNVTVESGWSSKDVSDDAMLKMEQPLNFYAKTKELKGRDAKAQSADIAKIKESRAEDDARRIGGDKAVEQYKAKKADKERKGSAVDADTFIGSAPDGHRVTGGLRVSTRISGVDAHAGDIMYVDVGVLPKAGEWKDRLGSYVNKSVFVRGQFGLIVTPLEYSGDTGTLKITFLRDEPTFAFDLIGNVNLDEKVSGTKDLRVTPVTFYRKDGERPTKDTQDKWLAGHADDYHMQVLSDRAHIWAPDGIPDDQPQRAADNNVSGAPSKGDQPMPEANKSDDKGKGDNKDDGKVVRDKDGKVINDGVSRNPNPSAIYDSKYRDPRNTRNLPTLDEAKQMAKDGTLIYNADGTVDVWVPTFGELVMTHDLKSVAFAKITKEQASKFIEWMRTMMNVGIQTLDKNGFINGAALKHISGMEGANSYVDENNCLVFVTQSEKGEVKRYAGDDLGNKSCQVYNDKRSGMTPKGTPAAEGNSKDAKDSNTNGPEAAANTPGESVAENLVNASFGAAVEAMSKDPKLREEADKNGFSKLLPDTVRADLDAGGDGSAYYNNTPDVAGSAETKLPTTGEVEPPKDAAQPGEQGSVVGSGKGDGTIDTNSSNEVAALTPSETKRLRLIDTVNSLRGTGKVSDDTISELLEMLRSTDGKDPAAVDAAEQKIKDALGGELPEWKDPYANAGGASKDDGAASTSQGIDVGDVTKSTSEADRTAAKAASPDTTGVVYGQGTTNSGTSEGAATGAALAQSADRSTGKGPVSEGGSTSTGKGLVTGEGAAERDWTKVGLGVGSLLLALLVAAGGVIFWRRREIES